MFTFTFQTVRVHAPRNLKWGQGPATFCLAALKILSDRNRGQGGVVCMLLCAASLVVTSCRPSERMQVQGMMHSQWLSTLRMAGKGGQRSAGGARLLACSGQVEGPADCWQTPVMASCGCNGGAERSDRGCAEEAGGVREPLAFTHAAGATGLVAAGRFQ